LFPADFKRTTSIINSQPPSSKSQGTRNVQAPLPSDLACEFGIWALEFRLWDLDLVRYSLRSAYIGSTDTAPARLHQAGRDRQQRGGAERTGGQPRSARRQAEQHRRRRARRPRA
jgi:hypothetical protein